MTVPSEADPDFVSRDVVAHRRFYLDLDTRPRAPLAVVCGGWEHCASGYRIDRVDFPYLGVELVASGRGELRLAGTTHELGPGSCFAYGQGVAHTIVSSPRAPLRKWFLDLAGREAAPAAAQAGLAPGAARQLAAPSAAVAIFEALLAAGRSPGARDDICAPLARALLAALAHARPIDAGDAQARATWSRCRATIEEAQGAITSVAEAARRCGVSPAYLSRLCARFEGMPANRHVQLVRVRLAADLLRAGRSVGEAAESVGFANPFHFSRVFKRLLGAPPSALRR